MTIDDFGFSSYRKEEEKRKQTSFASAFLNIFLFFARNRKQEKPNAYLEIHLSFFIIIEKDKLKCC